MKLNPSESLYLGSLYDFEYSNANVLVRIRTNAKWKNTDSHISQLIQLVTIGGNISRILRIGYQTTGLTTKITIAHARIDGESFAVKLFKILE